MLKNYLTVAIRNLARHKVYSFINIAGLAIGMACCALIMLYVQYEMSYDNFHTKGDRIYHIVRETHTEEGNKKEFHHGTSGPLAPALMQDIPEVEKAVRIYGRWVVTRHEGEQSFQGSDTWVFVDPDFFTIFDLPFVKGDPATALQNPGSALISEKTAQKYFGTSDPIGKTITGNVYGEFDVIITGVVRIPPNSTIGFAFATTSTPVVKSRATVSDRWQNWTLFHPFRPIGTYVLLREGVDPKTVEAKLPNLMERYMGSEVRATNTYHLQPLERMHLYNQVDYEGYKGILNPGNIEEIYLFSAIAGLILLIACINFMNLSTARSTNRAKEVGMRKVSGAYRFQIVYQFLGEAILLTSLAFVLAIGLTELALPKFNAFVGKDLTLFHSHWFLVPGFVVIIGFLAGCYPAFFLSAFEPVTVLKGHTKTGVKGALIRKGLVIFQFAMSILFIISTIVVYYQLNYMQNKDLGINKDFIIRTNIAYDEHHRRTPSNAKHVETIKQTLLAHPNVLKITAGTPLSGNTVGKEISTEDGNVFHSLGINVDEDFLETYDIPLLAGRNFGPGDETNEVSQTILINETALKLLGWKNPIGKVLFDTHKRPHIVLGVIGDFHSQSLHTEIKPLFIYYKPLLHSILHLKVRSESLPETLAFIEKTWKQFRPDESFTFGFLDERIERLYREEIRTGQMVGTFSILAIIVACLGLFGLAAFTAEQKTKEIGIRKVLGASVSSIVTSLSTDFAKLVLIANLIAWPVAYFLTRDWLDNFAYRVDLSWWIFGLGGILALLIALGTVGYQAMRAALANPIDALRDE